MTHSAIRSAASRAERRGIVAIFAVFALLVQILAPGFASAAPRLPDGSLLICADGAMTAPQGVPAPPGADDHPCDHCICPPAMFTPASAIGVARITYARRIPATAPSPRFRTPPARAPPRPPGQGPPVSHT
jgi:hypothetical protein